MKKLLANKKGGLYSWTVALAVTFGTILIYVVLYDLYMNTLPNLCVDMGVPSDDTSLAILKVVFQVFPLMMSIGTIIWAFLDSQRYEPRSGTGF